MNRVAALFMVSLLARTATLAAQDVPPLSPSNAADRWRVVTEPAAEAQPAPPARLVPPLSFQPLVLISESPPPPVPASSPPPVYRVPVPSAPIYAHPPQPVPPPVTVYKPLVPITPPPKQYYVGRGLFGQPKLYVPDQPIRNFLRYFSF